MAHAWRRPRPRSIVLWVRGNKKWRQSHRLCRERNSTARSSKLHWRLSWCREPLKSLGSFVSCSRSKFDLPLRRLEHRLGFLRQSLDPSSQSLRNARSNRQLCCRSARRVPIWLRVFGLLVSADLVSLTQGSIRTAIYR